MIESIAFVGHLAISGSGSIERGERDGDDAIVFRDRVDGDALTGRTGEDSAGCEFELGVVPRAGDASVFDRAKGNRGVGVGTAVFECVDDAIVADQGKTVALEGVRAAFALLEVFGSGDGEEGHGGGFQITVFRF